MSDETAIDAQPVDEKPIEATPAKEVDPFITPDTSEKVAAAPSDIRLTCPVCNTAYDPRTCGVDDILASHANVPQAVAHITVCCVVCQTQFDTHVETMEQTTKGLRSWKTAFLFATPDTIALVQRVTTHGR